MPFFPSQYGNLFGKGTVQRPVIYGEGEGEDAPTTQTTDPSPSTSDPRSQTSNGGGGGGRGPVVITSRGVFPAPPLNGVPMPRMGFMPTNTPVPSALNSVPAGTVFVPYQTPAFGALALQSNPAHYGSPDSDDVKRGLAGAGAAGFGLMGALIGAAVGAGIQFRGKPLKDGWLYGAIAGFMLPVIVLAPKSEDAA